MRLITYIYTIGAAQGLVLAIALFRKHSNQSSNRVLAVWMLLLVCDLTMKVVFLNNQNTPLLPLYGLVKFFPFLYGSFFYLYVRTLATSQKLAAKDVIHFIGFLSMAGINLPWMVDHNSYPPVGNAWFDLLLYLYSVSYVVAGLLTIKRYRQALEQQLSNTEGVSLVWLDVMAYFQALIWFIAVSQWLIPYPAYNFWIIYVAVALWMTVMGYMALQQQNIRPVKSFVTPAKVEDERFAAVDAKLSQLMQQQHLYLEPTLTIGTLARKAGYPEYLVSLVINQRHHRSFREYINHLRIEAAKVRLLKNDPGATILEVAYECGFTSKSTFNTAFKRITRMTPSEFKSKQQVVNATADGE